MQRARLLIRRLHLWLGLGVGALFVLLGLTGSALVFYQEVDAALHPEIRVVAMAPAPGWQSPVWDRGLATLRARWPDRKGKWTFEATGKAGAIPVRYQPPHVGHHGARQMLWLSPDGSRILRTDMWGGYAMTWIYDLHMQLLVHDGGRDIIGWAGVVILVLLLSGLWAWWPRGSYRKALRYKADAPATRKLRDIHKLTALATLPLLILLVLTGVMLALPDPSNAVLVSAVGPVDKSPSPLSSADRGRPISIAQALAAAHRAMPSARLAWIEVPEGGSGVFRMRVQQPNDPSYRFPHSYVFIDQYDGTVRGVQDSESAGASSTINAWLHPLHEASVGGLFFRVIVAAIGIAPVILFVTGVMRWTGRGRKRRGTIVSGG